MLKRYGVGNKPLINTESALMCHQATTACLQMQASYVTRTYAEALALGLRAQIHYAWINEEWKHTGLVLPDLTPKPAYRAFQVAATWLKGAAYAGRARGYSRGIEGYRFRPAGADYRLDVVWSADGRPRELFLSRQILAYDRDGRPLSGPRVSIGRHPLYVARFLHSDPRPVRSWHQPL